MHPRRGTTNSRPEATISMEVAYRMGTWTYCFGEGRNHDRLCPIVWPSWQTLPQLLGDEWHERMQQLQTLVQTGVKRVLGRQPRLGRRPLVSHRLHRLLQAAQFYGP